MTQRGRKTNSRNIEDNGGNALFTMGLITVVALLIVGWVMTQGGWQPLADRGEILSFSPNQSNAAPQPDQNIIVMQPTPTPSPLTNPEAALTPPLDASAPAEQLEEIRSYYETQMRLERQSFEQQLDDLKNRHRQELNEINMQLRLLEMENRRLQGE